MRTAFVELTAAVTEIAARANPRQLRVSVVPSFAARWLLPRIGRFVAAYPDVDLDVRANSANIDFANDDSDMAIRYGFGEWPGLGVEFLLEDRFFPVCSPRIENGRLPQHPSDLANYPLLRSGDELWKPWFEAAGLDWPEPERGPMFNDSAHLIQAAAEGQGIALARATLLGTDERNGVLVRLYDIELPSARKHYLVYPARTASSAKLALFRTWLHDEIEQDRKLSTPDRGRSARSAHRTKRR